MAKQIIIIGCKGEVSTGLVKQLVDRLLEKGLEVEHASIRHGEKIAVVTGTENDVGAVHVGEPRPIGEVTLETLDGKLNSVLGDLRLLKKAEKKEVAPPKGKPVLPEKKGGGAEGPKENGGPVEPKAWEGLGGQPPARPSADQSPAPETPAGNQASDSGEGTQAPAAA